MSAGNAVPVGDRPGTGPSLPAAPGLPAGTRSTVTAVDVAAGTAVPVRREARVDPVAAGASATGSAVVAPVSGWAPVGDGVSWQHDLVTAAVRVSDPLDHDGAGLFAWMTAPDATDVGRPTVEHLPAELDDAVLVARRQLVDGALSMRVDLVRHAPDLEVVVSARLPEPAHADAAVTALVQLLTAVGAHDDRGRLAG